MQEQARPGSAARPLQRRAQATRPRAGCSQARARGCGPSAVRQRGRPEPSRRPVAAGHARGLALRNRTQGGLSHKIHAGLRYATRPIRQRPLSPAPPPPHARAPESSLHPTLTDRPAVRAEPTQCPRRLPASPAYTVGAQADGRREGASRPPDRRTWLAAGRRLADHCGTWPAVFARAGSAAGVPVAHLVCTSPGGSAHGCLCPIPHHCRAH